MRSSISKMNSRGDGLTEKLEGGLGQTKVISVLDIQFLERTPNLGSRNPLERGPKKGPTRESRARVRHPILHEEEIGISSEARSLCQKRGRSRINREAAVAAGATVLFVCLNMPDLSTVCALALRALLLPSHGGRTWGARRHCGIRR